MLTREQNILIKIYIEHIKINKVKAFVTKWFSQMQGRNQN